MGMNHFGEISLLTNIAKPDICIITNIGTSHIGNLGSRENILKAKLEILEGTENPTVIINNDNDLLHKWYEENKDKMKIYTYAIDEKSFVNAKNIVLNDTGSEFTCVINDKNEKVKVPVGGNHFVINALCAVTVGEVLKIDSDKILKGIEEFELTKKRMDITEKNGVKIINDAYNASLESVKAGLEYISKLDCNKKIAVIGDMLELGDYSKDLHEQVGKQVYKNNIDILICSGENSKYIVKQAELEGMNTDNIYYFENKDDIVNTIKELVKTNDVVWLKASKAMKFYELAENIINSI